jgi:sugar phosphate isomerase/epimerase
MSDIVALQLYTVRDETEKNFKLTIQRVAEIGYAGVEFAGYGNLPSKELATLLADTGLKAVGSHIGLHAFDADFEREINYCLDIGCSLAVIPWLDPQWRTGEGFKKLAEKLNEYGRRAQQRGVTLAYHNHDFEFQPDGNSTLLDNLVQATDPAYVKLELDTYWAAYAGVDPVAFIKKYPGRIASLHLKDMTPDRTFTEVGSGTLDIASFIEAAQENGTKIFIVENDQPQVPSLESARISLENLHRSLT